MRRAFHTETAESLATRNPEGVLDGIVAGSSVFDFTVVADQRHAWIEEIKLLRSALTGLPCKVYFEFTIPRMAKRADVVLLLGAAVVVIEFKVGSRENSTEATEQAWDYALDLKNFHEPTHQLPVVPVVVATESTEGSAELGSCEAEDRVWAPIRANPSSLPALLRDIASKLDEPAIVYDQWESGRYSPTPTIIEAARALYSSHSVVDISRSDAAATNLTETSTTLDKIIEGTKVRGEKAVCLVTGVPGAGKTLVGLNVATTHLDPASELHSVYLSGNGPLVNVLVEALTRDKVERDKVRGVTATLSQTRSQVKAFVQNVHHFRDESIEDNGPPDEHVVIFDEAQRAWDLPKTQHFMERRKRKTGFSMSEPEFLISCMDRQPDWCTVICLVGEGQEIHTGEAGISEWVAALNRSFPTWRVYASKHLLSDRYGSQDEIKTLASRGRFELRDGLHLAISLRSFRAGAVSTLVDAILDGEAEHASRLLASVDRYPIVVTRYLTRAKAWVKARARGSERFGLLVSSSAERLKPHAIDIRAAVDPVHWFLDGKNDTRSSFYLEDAATEFQVQGLELDWTCVVWDADLRLNGRKWEHWKFAGSKWLRVLQAQRRQYLQNAYRVLLTRARQGMAIVVPEGDPEDPTRLPGFYDDTFRFLQESGLPTLP